MTPKPILDGLQSMEVLSQGELDRMKEHKYSVAGRSISEVFLQPFWCWLVEQVPRTLAPNTITLIGLAANIFSTLILVFFCPTMKEEAPSWAYVFAAVCLFMYQSLDAIDGKQARRTNSANQLGELFDHGCDAVSIVFVSVSGSISLQYGYYPRINFIVAAMAIFLYYAAHWQTYVSGTLSFGKVDVTEGQILYCTFFLTTAVMGPEFWKTQVPVLDMELKVLLYFFGVVVSFITAYNYGRVIFGGGKGRNGSTVADTSVIAPFFHIGSIILLHFAIWQKSTTDIFSRQPCLYIIMMGFVASKVTIKLVIAHMTKSGMSFLDTAFIGPGLLFLNQYLDTLVSEDLVLVLALMWCTFDLGRYCAAICVQISGYLGIYTFDITCKPPSSESKVGVTTRRQAKMAQN